MYHVQKFQLTCSTTLIYSIVSAHVHVLMLLKDKIEMFYKRMNDVVFVSQMEKDIEVKSLIHQGFHFGFHMVP